MKRKAEFSSWSKNTKFKQIVGTAAASTLGWITMNVPGAMIAGKKTWDFLAPEIEKDEVTQNILMPGNYQGKFGLTARNAFKGLRDKYQKRGGVAILENYGTVADPDLVYVGHSSWSEATAITAIGLAILRKLFRVGIKLDPETPYEELPLVSSLDQSGPNGYIIVYEGVDSDGTKSTFNLTVPVGESLQTLVGNASGGASLYDIVRYMITESNPLILQVVYLYAQGPNAAKLLHKMDMTKEVLTIAMSSHMVIQNRTLAATGESTSTEVNNVQPLKGPVYEFDIGVPTMKHKHPTAFSEMLGQGLVLVRTSQLGGTDVTSFKEPPVKNSFQKVTKQGYVRLNSGAIKSMTIGTDCSGYFANVLYKLRYNSENNRIKACYGKSQMVILEEELNSGSANNITVQYECQHITGAELTTTYNPNMQPAYSSQTISNVP